MASPGLGLGAAIFGGFGQGLSEGVKGAASYLQHQKQLDTMDKYYRHRAITGVERKFWDGGGWFRPMAIEDGPQATMEPGTAPDKPMGDWVSAEALGGQ